MEEANTMDGLIELGFAGFTDFKYFYPDPDTKWVTIGLVFWFISFLSTIPQVHAAIHERSNYGLSPISMLCNNLSQFFLMCNVICMQSADFVGIAQHPFKVWAPRLQTFLNHSTQWVMYLPIVFSHIIFFDRIPRKNRDAKAINFAYYQTLASIFFLVVVINSMFLTWAFLGTHYNWNTPAIINIGRFCGMGATILEISQFLPQLFTTIKLQDNGSLSMLMMCIQMPSSYANGLFLVFGQHADWSTFMTTFVDATDQLILLSTCIFFKLRRLWRKKYVNQAELAMNILLESDTVNIDEDSSIAEYVRTTPKRPFF